MVRGCGLGVDNYLFLFWYYQRGGPIHQQYQWCFVLVSLLLRKMLSKTSGFQASYEIYR